MEQQLASCFELPDEESFTEIRVTLFHEHRASLSIEKDGGSFAKKTEEERWKRLEREIRRREEGREGRW